MGSETYRKAVESNSIPADTTSFGPERLYADRFMRDGASAAEYDRYVELVEEHGVEDVSIGRYDDGTFELRVTPIGDDLEHLFTGETPEGYEDSALPINL